MSKKKYDWGYIVKEKKFALAYHLIKEFECKYFYEKVLSQTNLLMIFNL